jgi:hypothetical protein
VYHGKETNAGYAQGRISYGNSVGGTVGPYANVSLFDGGGGAAFQLCSPGNSCVAAAAAPVTSQTLCLQQTCQDYDIFTGTSGTALTSHTSGGGQSWAAYTANSSGGTLKLNGSGAVAITGASTNVYAAALDSLTPASANYKVSATCTTLVAAAYACTLYARTPSTSTQGYVFQCRYDRATSGGCVMFNATVQIGSSYTYSGFATNGNSHVMTLGVNGTAITGSIDGLPVVTATDSSISAAGQAGLQVGGQPSTGTPSSSMSNWLVQ